MKRRWSGAWSRTWCRVASTSNRTNNANAADTTTDRTARNPSGKSHSSSDWLVTSLSSFFIGRRRSNCSGGHQVIGHWQLSKLRARSDRVVSNLVTFLNCDNFCVRKDRNCDSSSLLTSWRRHHKYRNFDVTERRDQKLRINFDWVSFLASTKMFSILFPLWALQCAFRPGRKKFFWPF